MPYHVTEKKLYKIDYENLFQYLMSLKLFKRRTIQKEYIETWITYLKDLDAQYEQFYNERNEEELIGGIDDNEEIFPQQLIFKDNIIFVQFRVTKIVDILASLKYQQASIQDFGFRQRYHFTKTEGKQYNLKSAPSTIIAEMFSYPATDGYVIDGNHRLTSAIANGYDRIQYKFIDEKTLSLHEEAFATKWDYVFYLFINEISLFYNIIERNHTSIQELLKLSYLSEETFTYKLNEHYLVK